jgi:hypothetical protein
MEASFPFLDRFRERPSLLARCSQSRTGVSASTCRNSRRTIGSIKIGEPSVGAWGALIMSFFGAVFVALTLYWQWHLSGITLALPFLGFVLIGLAASYVIRAPGKGIKPSPKEERAIMWSSIGEGIGLFLAANIVVNKHRPDLLLPSMALVVGLHFLPIAFAAGFRPFYVLGTALIFAAIMGFIVEAPAGGKVAGLMAAGALWLASGIAVRRDWLAKRSTVATV